MQWNSVGEFLAMGGYGLYVWGSFGVCAATMLIEPILVAKRSRDILAGLRRERLADEIESQQS